MRKPPTRKRRTKQNRSKKSKASPRVFESVEAEREYWWSRTPAERLRELERLRQLKHNYGPGKPRPRFQPVMRVINLRDLGQRSLGEIQGG